MSTIRLQWLVALAAAGAGVACGGSGSGGGPSAQSLVATWIASPAHSSTAVEYVQKSNPSVKLDIVAAKGATVTLSLKQEGTFQLRMLIPNQAVRIEDGTWSIESDGTLTLTYSATSNQQFDAVLSGGMLTLTGADAPFDVNDDGKDEDTRQNMRMVQQ